MTSLQAERLTDTASRQGQRSEDGSTGIAYRHRLAKHKRLQQRLAAAFQADERALALEATFGLPPLTARR